MASAASEKEIALTDEERAILSRSLSRRKWWFTAAVAFGFLSLGGSAVLGLWLAHVSSVQAGSSLGEVLLAWNSKFRGDPTYSASFVRAVSFLLSALWAAGIIFLLIAQLYGQRGLRALHRKVAYLLMKHGELPEQGNATDHEPSRSLRAPVGEGGA